VVVILSQSSFFERNAFITDSIGDVARVTTFSPWAPGSWLQVMYVLEVNVCFAKLGLDDVFVDFWVLFLNVVTVRSEDRDTDVRRVRLMVTGCPESDGVEVASELPDDPFRWVSIIIEWESDNGESESVADVCWGVNLCWGQDVESSCSVTMTQTLSHSVCCVTTDV
jgi:hypothetical protein